MHDLAKTKIRRKVKWTFDQASAGISEQTSENAAAAEGISEVQVGL